MLITHIPFDIEEIMENFDTKKQYDINYIMKLYIIYYCSKNDLYSNILNEYNKIIKLIPSTLGKFASTINEDNIFSKFKKLQKLHNKTFLDFFNYYKLYERISWKNFKQIFIKKSMYKVFEYQSIVLHYDQELLSLIEEENSLIKMLVQEEFEEKTYNEKKLYLPSQLSPQKKEQLTQKYIMSSDADTNCLKLIFNTRGTNNFLISDRTRLLAKKKYEELWKTLSNKSNPSTYGCEITFCSIPNYETIEKYDGKIIHLEYSLEWIKDNLDFPTLLNNFIHLFGYCDKQFRINFVSLSRETGIFEMIFNNKGKKDYFTSLAFELKNKIHLLQMFAYCVELKKYNIEIQDIFKWFFEEYLKNEFNAEGFIYITPSKDTTYLEKCIFLSCSIDSVLKQFDMFSLNGCIERELFEISSKHIDFKNVKGFVCEKYAYPESDNIKKEAYLMFSDQSHLSYIAKEKNYSELYLLLENSKIKLSDFYEYQTEDIKWLIKRGSIYCDKNEFLMLNKPRVAILKNLYYNEVLTCSYVGKYKGTLHELIACGDIIIESTLFSRNEQEYLDFMLNNAKYENGPALRNNYIHGTHSLDSQKHENDYYELLKIMVMIIIKINEEFCIKYQNEQSTKQITNI